MRRIPLVVSLLVLATAAPAAAKSSANPCRGVMPDLRGTPRKVHAAPPASVTGALGVLRRPAQATDHMPTVFGTTHLIAGLEREVDVDYVRQLGRLPSGDHVFLVPGRRPV